MGTLEMKKESRISPPGKGAMSEKLMTRNPGSNIVRLSLSDWLILIGIIVPVAATVVMTTFDRQRELGVKINTVIVQQEVIDDRISRVEGTLDTLLLHDVGFSR